MRNDARQAWSADLLNGPVHRKLLSFAIPMLVISILESLNGFVNSVWVSRLLGPEALAATTNAHLVNFLLFVIMFGFAQPVAIMVGQSRGRGDLDGMRKAVGTAFTVFSVTGVVLAMIGFSFAGPIIHVLGTPADVAPMAISYLRMIAFAIPSILMTVVVSLALRGAGDPKTSLLFMCFAVGVDIVLNPVLILGLGIAPELGITGSALASAIANYAGLVGLLAYIYARDLPVRLRGKELSYLRPAASLVKVLLVMGPLMGLQLFAVIFSMLLFVGLVNQEGATLVAAFGAANQLWTYVQMPSIAVSGAASMLAAIYIGAGRWDKVYELAKVGTILCLAVSVVSAGIAFIISENILRIIIGPNDNIVRMGHDINIIGMWSLILFSGTAVYVAIMRANGAVLAPLLMIVIGLFPVRFGSIWLFWPWFGMDSLWYGLNMGSAVGLLLVIWIFRAGGWRKKSFIRASVHSDSRGAAAPEGA